MKTAALVVLALVAWGALVAVFAKPDQKPEPPAAWCWVGLPGFMYGEPCKYRKRFFNV